MMKNNIKIEANSEEGFPFTFYIEKAVPVDEGDEWVIEGVASTTNIDHDNERMAPEALTSMAEVINEKSVPLRVEHSKSDNAIVGKVFKAWVDERNQMWIKASLDKSHAASSILFKSLKDGIKLGLSVGGRVKHAVKELAESAGKMVKTFYQVILDEVSVTQHPANYDSYLIRKSFIKSGYTVDSADDEFQKDFLFETRANDYMYSIAKSIPEEAWKNVELKDYNNNVMNKKEKEMTEEETKTKAEATETETKEKAEETETEKSESTFKSMVVKSLENLTAIVSKLTKTEDKDTETKEKSAEETTIMEDGETKEKSEETETKEKAEDSETKEKKEDSETEEKSTNGSEYKMKSLVSKMESMLKAMDASDTQETETKEKTEEKESETTEKSIDTFVEQLEKSVNAMEDRLAKNGTRTPGLHQQIVSIIQNDAELQKSIKDLMQVPGAKRSVSMGIPFMKSKDGKMYRITAVDAAEEVTKSKSNQGKTFKELYKTELSSVAEANARG